MSAREITDSGSIVSGMASTVGRATAAVGAGLGRRHCPNATSPTDRFVNDRRGRLLLGLPVPFDTYHRNDLPDTIRAAAGGQVPVVVAETDSGKPVPHPL